MPIIDAHHHLWDLSAVDYPWLRAARSRFFGDPKPIACLHDLHRFRDAHGDHHVAGSVHVQVGAADPVEETRWLADVADAAGWPMAIVAAADLTAPDLRHLLDQLAAAARGRLRGVRQIVARHPAEDGADSGALLADRAFAEGLAVLAERGLSFDLQLIAPLLPRATALFAQQPQLRLALCHAGSPWDPDRVAMRSWARDLADMAAALPCAMAKLSGLGMLRPEGNDVAAIADGVLAAFGPTRTIWGSNWPVDCLHRPGWGALLEEAVTLVCSADRQAIFGGNAAAFYRLTV